MMNKTAITDVTLARRPIVNSMQRRVAQMSLCVFYSESHCSLQMSLSEYPLFIQSVGTEAQRILRNSTKGRILAVFQRSFYVQSDSGILCIGLTSLGQGPLHIQLGSSHELLFKNIDAGLEVDFCNSPRQLSDPQLVGALECAGKLSTTVYSGSVVQRIPRPLIDKAIQLAQACEAPLSSTAGFGWLLSKSAWQKDHSLNELTTSQLGTVDRAFRQQSFPAIENLFGWLADSISALADDLLSESSQADSVSCVVNRASDLELNPDVLALVGAGPGLTPSGDDLLAGVMLVLHRMHYTRLAESLWCTLEPSLALRTNAISGAHLRMAAQGQCSEPMLALLNRLMGDGELSASNDMKAVVHDIHSLAAQIGGSSGWDTLAGMSLVLRALFHQKQFVVPLTCVKKRHLSNASN